MNEPSYWVTAHLSVNFVPVFSTEPSLHKAKEQTQPTNLLGHSCTQKNPYCYHFSKMKALQDELQAHFGYLWSFYLRHLRVWQEF